MARGNCCDICTPPPDSCILGACCYDDGDNVDITCEEYVTESYCLTKANSVFNAGGVCGEKITCDSYYEPKISQLGLHSFIVIKSDGSVATWKTLPDDEAMMVSNEDALRIQSQPFSENGATRIYADGNQFCAVRKKDGTFVVWGKFINPSWTGNPTTASEIEEGMKNAKKVLFTLDAVCILREDGSIATFNIGNRSTSTFGGSIPQNLSPLLSDLDNPVVDIFVNSTQAGNNTALRASAFCALLKNGDAYIWGFDNFGSHAYDVNNNGVVSTSDQLSLLNFISRGDPYNSKYDVNNDGKVSTLDLNAIITYTSSYGSSSDSKTEGVQIPITNVSGVFGGASSFSFVKNDGSFYSTLNPGSKQSQLTNVSGVFFTQDAACALKYDGKVVAWGNPNYGGFIDPEIQRRMDLDVIDTIVSTERAFCATGGNRRFENYSDRENLFTWGSSFYGGDKSSVYTGNRDDDPSQTITFSDTGYDVRGTRNTFIILSRSSRFLHWGGVNYFGDPYDDYEFFSAKGFLFPQSVASNASAITTLNNKETNFGSSVEPGFVFSFGSFTHGGYGTTDRFEFTSDRPPTPIRKRRLNQIISNENAFAGIEQDGGIVCWGNGTTEGGCSQGGGTIPINIYSQSFIDEQLKKIGDNVNLHGDLITAGYEGCTSSSTQKDFCKTEDDLRVDCNPHTGHCDYGLGDFYPFIKVNNCKECEEISNEQNYSLASTNIHRFTRDGVLVPNFQTTQDNSLVNCFNETSICGSFQNPPITTGYRHVVLGKRQCEEAIPTFTGSSRGVAVSGDETYYSKFPTPITGEDVGPGPSGSCCFGLICEEGYNEYKHRPTSEQCKDFKICYEVLTEKQCYDQRFSLYAGPGGSLPFIKTRGISDSPLITYKTYHDFVPDVNCVDRTGEEGCQP